MQKKQRLWPGPAHLGCLAVLAGVCLSACGSSDRADTSAAGHRKPPQQAPAAAADPTSDMSLAAGTPKVASPVEVKFQMASRPMPGQPLSVSLVLIPDPTVAAVGAKFEGDGSGLALVSGEQLALVEKPAPRMPIRHTVVLLPKADGIYTLTATVTVKTDEDPKVRTFAIPVIAGNGLPALKVQSEPGKSRP